MYDCRLIHTYLVVLCVDELPTLPSPPAGSLLRDSTRDSMRDKDKVLYSVCVCVCVCILFLSYTHRNMMSLQLG